MNLENDKKFDELFKRAAENYPLKTDNSNWNAVLSQLEEKKKRTFFLFEKKYLALLLLFIFTITVSSIITLLIVNKSLDNNNKKQLTNSTIIAEKNKATVNKKSLNNEQNKVAQSIQKEPKNTLPSTTKKIVEQVNTIKQLEMPSTTNSESSNIKKSISTKKTPNQSKQYLTKIFEKKSFTSTLKNKPVTSSFLENEFNTKSTVTVNQQKNNTLKNDVLNNKVDSLKTDTSAKKTSNILVTKKQATTAEDSTQKSNNKLSKKTINQEKYFYTGLLYANDINAIKFEPNKGEGYSWSILLGYRFNKSISIETGFHIEKKEYYTTGEHFNKEILNANGRVLWIEAENKLIEIPVTLKVDAFKFKKHSLFTTVGLSSYIVNKEAYEYEEEVNGVLQEGNVIYTNNTSNFFASINCSIGYQYNFGKFGNLRIEPYLNLPLKGIGISKEKLISRGIYFGWIYNFSKRKLKH